MINWLEIKSTKSRYAQSASIETYIERPFEFLKPSSTEDHKLGDLVEKIDRPMEVEIDEDIVMRKDEDRVQIEWT